MMRPEKSSIWESDFEMIQPITIIMGASGSGKSTVGRALADALGCPFYDGDDFHPPQNVAKMAAGTPLTDADRGPWLARLAELIRGHLERDEPAVLACSALKRAYRDVLRVDPAHARRIRFVYLQGDFDTLRQRMAARPDHFMRPEMLRSQFTALEEPGPDEAALVLPVTLPVDALVQAIRDG